MISLQHKRIWITGASSGIGKALALAMAPEKPHLILSGRQAERLQAVAEQCQGLGAEVEMELFDLESPSETEASAAKVLAGGKVDILVNNAGRSQRSLIHETKMEVYERLIQLDFLANIRLTKALLNSWIAEGGGQVVVISSLVGKFSTPYRSGYAAAKHALHGFYDALRAEQKHHNVKVTMICPGFIRTAVSINSFTGDGGKLNDMDRAQKKGMDPDLFARKALRAIKAEKAEVYIGGKEKAGVYLSRYLPNLFRKMLPKVKVR